MPWYDGQLYTVLNMMVRRRDRNGYGAGTVADPNNVSVSEGSVISPALEVAAILSSEGLEITRRNIGNTGGGQRFWDIDVGVSAAAPFNITLSRLHTLLNNAISNVQLEELRSGGEGIRAGGSQPDARILNNLLFAVQQQLAYVDDENEDVVSDAFFMSTYSGKLREPRKAANSQDGDDPVTLPYQALPISAKRAWDGRLFKDIDAVQGDSVAEYPYAAPAQMMTEDMWLDGTTGTLQLKYKPAYPAQISAVNGYNLFTLNGVIVAFGGLTADGVLTPPANVSGDRATITYLHNGELA